MIELILASSMLALFALVWFKGRGAIDAFFENKVAEITSEISEARKQREEADAIRQNAEHTRADAEAYAKRIVDQAVARSEQMLEQAAKDAKDHAVRERAKLEQSFVAELENRRRIYLDSLIDKSLEEAKQRLLAHADDKHIAEAIRQLPEILKQK